MTEIAVTYLPSRGQHLPFATDLREAVALYARHRWPSNTSGHMAFSWKISKDQAKNLLKGHASDKTITHVLRVGGWQMCLDVIGSTIGETLDDHLVREREKAKQREVHLLSTREALAESRLRRADLGRRIRDRMVG